MKKSRPKKTNAVRILEQHGVLYELRTYDVDERDLSGETVADKIGMPYGQVFKTLVARGDKTGHLIACVPVDSELDLKALAKASGNKKTEMAPLKDVQGLTGYIRGGVSPVGTKKPYPVYIDESAKKWPVVSLSAGVRGCQMLVVPGDLENVLTLSFCPLAK